MGSSFFFSGSVLANLLEMIDDSLDILVAARCLKWTRAAHGDYKEVLLTLLMCRGGWIGPLISLAASKAMTAMRAIATGTLDGLPGRSPTAASRTIEDAQAPGMEAWSSTRMWLPTWDMPRGASMTATRDSPIGSRAGLSPKRTGAVTRSREAVKSSTVKELPVDGMRSRGTGALPMFFWGNLR